VLSDQLHNVVVRPAGNTAGDGAIRLEDQPAAFGRVEFAQDLGADLFAVTPLPLLNIEVAAAMVDHGQAVGVTVLDHCLDPRFEVLAPAARGEEQTLAIGDVAPDHETIEAPGGGPDGSLAAG
jgi:hypothetical protein